MPWYVNSLFAQAATGPPSIPWYVDLLVAVATIVGSFFLGGYWARSSACPTTAGRSAFACSACWPAR